MFIINIIMSKILNYKLKKYQPYILNFYINRKLFSSFSKNFFIIIIYSYFYFLLKNYINY